MMSLSASYNGYPTLENSLMLRYLVLPLALLHARVPADGQLSNTAAALLLRQRHGGLLLRLRAAGGGLRLRYGGGGLGLIL
jgi:hypothetical protein